MSELRRRIERDENAFQTLLAAIPGFDGYREREMRRTADKLLRERLVADLDPVREALKDVVAQWARAGRLQELDDVDRLSRLLDKARDTLRFADYGYTGFFDAVKIKEEELDRLYAYDLSLKRQVEACRAAVADLATAEPERAAEAMRALEDAINNLQRKLDEREQVVIGAVQEGAE